ncbi:MAG: hypothetical protein NTV24_04335 [Candidatus Woesebacteria bacterium]|nr:hypothetical protein [Candidatus Woesebacteria bacterium]
MKKYLPFILLGVGIIVLIIVILVIKKNKSNVPVEKEDTTVTLSLNERPVASLTPSADGHWLKLTLTKILSSAASMDYELLYQLPDGRTQGVPGTIKLTGQDKIERDLLMGSESSGKFRYDEGVKEGTLTIRFRNDAGKLITKLTTKFALLSKTKELKSIDEKVTYKLTSINSKDFFVVMETFGVPKEVPAELTTGPFGVFTSSKTAVSGTVTLEGTNIYLYSGSSWTKLDSGKSSNTGIFIGTN